MIAAQCPMTSYPEGFANTIEDMKRMLIEQDVKIWVQLSPVSQRGELMTAMSDGSTKSFCEVFPLRYWSSAYPSVGNGGKHREGVSNFLSAHNQERGFFNLTYTLTAFVRRAQVGGRIIETVFDATKFMERLQSLGKVVELCSFLNLYRNYKDKRKESEDLNYAPHVDEREFDCDSFSCDASDKSCGSSESFAGWEMKVLDIEHLWFYKWNDFEIPSATYMGTVNKLADRTADFISKGYRSAITCFSGRGRTGTFSAIVLAKLKLDKGKFDADLRLMSIRGLPNNNGHTNENVSSTTVVDTDGDVNTSNKNMSVTDLVDIIVDMRRSRDGLVETPTQLKFVIDVLKEYH
mmetsp:Transcript_20374/g.34333  ORF Transcript_20374/g.34333 Transcript_20374/m.34333 type:complete len:349 (-) Transcript_20374:2013-3059(-)